MCDTWGHDGLPQSPPEHPEHSSLVYSCTVRVTPVHFGITIAMSSTFCSLVHFCAVSSTTAPFRSLVNFYAVTTTFASVVVSQTP